MSPVEMEKIVNSALESSFEKEWCDVCLMLEYISECGEFDLSWFYNMDFD